MDIIGNNNSGNSPAQPMEIGAADFMEKVIAASQTAPVVVVFTMPKSEVAAEAIAGLAAAIGNNNAGITLATFNIDAPENAPIAAQLRVQTVPTVYAFMGGQPVDGFAGAQNPAQIDAFIKKILALAGGDAGAAIDADAALEAAETALGAKNFEAAAGAYQEILAALPTEARAMAGLLRCFIGMNALGDAREMLDALEDDLRSHNAVAAAATALEMAEKSSASAGQIDSLAAKVSANPKDAQAHFDYAGALYGSGDAEAAIDALLESIRLDREWNDAAARKQLLDIFAALGPTAPEVISGRRKLSSMLFS